MKGSSFWNVTFPRLLSSYAILIFSVLWVGFAVALARDREWLDVLWNGVQAMPMVARAIVWIALLPIMVGLWVWESGWSDLGRLVGLAGIVSWTLVAASSFLRAWRPVKQ